VEADDDAVEARWRRGERRRRRRCWTARFANEDATGGDNDNKKREERKKVKNEKGERKGKKEKRRKKEKEIKRKRKKKGEGILDFSSAYTSYSQKKLFCQTFSKTNSTTPHNPLHRQPQPQLYQTHPYKKSLLLVCHYKSWLRPVCH
jgi:hypothetical protein